MIRKMCQCVFVVAGRAIATHRPLSKLRASGSCILFIRVRPGSHKAALPALPSRCSSNPRVGSVPREEEAKLHQVSSRAFAPREQLESRLRTSRSNAKRAASLLSESSTAEKTCSAGGQMSGGWTKCFRARKFTTKALSFEECTIIVIQSMVNINLLSARQASSTHSFSRVSGR